MKRPLLATRIPFFGSLAMLVLCMVFFLLPFFFRSARFAIDDVRNEVSDWLPPDFKETEELREFRNYFLGDQFVLISWPDCNKDDQNFHRLVEAIRSESLENDVNLNEEELRARDMGDKYGWHFVGSYHEDAASEQEKWFQGNNGKWYYIKRDGAVYRWKGENDLLQGVTRYITRQFKGHYEAEGEIIGHFGTPQDNEFYADPRKLFARFFKGVQTGPDILEQLAGKEGSLRVFNSSEDSDEALNVRIEANQRLTGALFGPTPVEGFDWTAKALYAQLSESRRALLPEGWEEELELHVEEIAQLRHDGDRQALLDAPQEKQLEYWFLWWDRLGLEPPPRQTCIIATLNEPVISDFSYVVGRGLLGKPRGRIQELAIFECGIKPENLHIGGPPVDNVSIDEEGSITLLRLASLSGIIGISLAMLSFRSLRITIMLFFVGGVAAISSLGIVWMMGDSMDAILMSMPSLVYVLGLSGAIHVVNYYRDACHEHGRRFAVSTAVKHAIFPCSIAAFTTALGLISLCTSSLKPINKFGFYSAIAVVGTLALLFTYLPAALEVFPPGFRRRRSEKSSSAFGNIVEAFWLKVGQFVSRFHWGVNAIVITSMLLIGLGIQNIETSVQLLKLFHPEAKVLQDYKWLESNIGKLVPMEIQLRISSRVLDPIESSATDESSTETEATTTAGNSGDQAGQKLAVQTVAYHGEGQPASLAFNEADLVGPKTQDLLRYNVQQRLELVHLLRHNLEQVFGPEGQNIIGSGMALDTFLPNPDSLNSPGMMNEFLEKDFNKLPTDFLYSPFNENRKVYGDQAPTDDELWRISLRLGAFLDVDYGRFVNEIKQVIEPSLKACDARNRILIRLAQQFQFARGDEERPFNILLLGSNGAGKSVAITNEEEAELQADKTLGDAANQEVLFSKTLSMLLEQKGLKKTTSIPGQGQTRNQYWLSPQKLAENGYLTDPNKLQKLLQRFPVVILIDDSVEMDKSLFERDPNTAFLDVSGDYQFRIDPETKQPMASTPTAEELRTEQSVNVDVSAVYTGVIPIVYKAQRTLLKSLVESIFLAFFMIAGVMMILLRPWHRGWSWGTALNVRGGLISMLPNIFPIVMIFGAMGHLGIKVDIGSMMTASVAMGVAVDDTIHFLTWYRESLGHGLTRKQAIMESYRRCATAMTQTTLIAGFGLFAFAFSTFTPTQRFGTLMLVLLAMALVGDLVFLPALLASPFGKFFGEERVKGAEAKKKQERTSSNPDDIVRDLMLEQEVLGDAEANPTAPVSSDDDGRPHGGPHLGQRSPVSDSKVGQSRREES